MRLLLGNEALAWGAMDGGARFYAGHPLQASAEIDRALLSALPERGGTAVLVEDEAAALAATLGAGAGGLLGVTATNAAGLAVAGPLIEHAAAAGIPAILAVVGSPGEAPATSPRPVSGIPRVETASQRELGPLRWCAPGAPALPVYAPASAGECYTLARAAAHEATARSSPVVLYVDHVIGHLREPVEDAALLDDAPERADSFRVRDAVVLVVAVGIVARAARSAVRLARDRGVRAGLFRPVRLWPFPEMEFREAAAGVERVIVAELNEGQLVETVASAAAGLDPRPSVRSLADGGMLEPDRIAAALEESP
jgi:2-oxoglutarate ferredoxin oxidoreductase subunit alpha